MITSWTSHALSSHVRHVRLVQSQSLLLIHSMGWKKRFVHPEIQTLLCETGINMQLPKIRKEPSFQTSYCQTPIALSFSVTNMLSNVSLIHSFCFLYVERAFIPNCESVMAMRQIFTRKHLTFEAGSDFHFNFVFEATPGSISLNLLSIWMAHQIN